LSRLKLLKLLILLLAAPATPVEAAILRYTLRVRDSSADPTARVPQIVLADTEAECPSTDVADGDACFAKDTDRLLWRSAATWVGVAPSNATYWTASANTLLSDENSLAGFTGLVLNTTGTPSSYAGTSCTNQFPRSLNASGAATCASVADADLASNYSGVGSCTNQFVRTLNDNAAPTCATVALATDVGAFSSSDLRGRLTDEVGTGAAVFGIDEDMADDMTTCTGGQVLRRNAGDTAWECATISGGGAPTDAEYIVAEGHASLSAEIAPSADDQVASSDSSTSATWKTLPNGAVGYATGTNTFSQAGISNLASSTSADLSAVLSDETGSGAAVFGTSPTLAGTPVVGDGAGNDKLSFAEEAGDPTCAAGDFFIWATSSTNVLRKCQNGTISNLDTGGSGASAGATGDVQYSSDGAGGFGAEAAFNYAAAGNELIVPGLRQQEDLAIEGDLTPAQITANQNDYNPTNLATASVLRLDSDASRDVTGLAGGADGRVIIIDNISTALDGTIVLKNESASSTAGNRFSFDGDKVLDPGESMILQYDSTASRWKQRGSRRIGNGSFRRRPFWHSDFQACTSDVMLPAPFNRTLISSGTMATGDLVVASDRAQHPGVCKVTSSTTANSGAYIGSESTHILIAGGEVVEIVFLLETTTNTTVRMGLLDSTTSADAVDGAYIEIPASTSPTCKTANNSTRTTSATIATIATNTWYLARVEVNAAATSVTCSLYSDAGNLLGSQTNSTNIPTANGRETAVRVIGTNSGTTATDVIHLDYLAIEWKRALAR
jgi:hypothetical protein